MADRRKQMELQEIEVLIDKDGQVHLHVRGAKGLDCLALTRDVEAVLGSQVILREMTPESQEKSGSGVLDQKPLNLQDK
jgi:hypothetical protein